MKFLIFLLLSAVPVASLGGRGSKTALNLIAARTSNTHPLHSTTPTTIWCTPDNPQVTIKTATFTRESDGQKLAAKLSADKKNASHTFDSPSVKDTGEYTCELDTPHGKIKHKAIVYVRPVALINVEHFTVKDDNEYHLEHEGINIDKGGAVNITCPVTGHPAPTIKWSKDGAPLKLTSSVQLQGSTIRINAADYENSGNYVCEAVNEYTSDGKTSKLLLVIEKSLNVRSEVAWLVPLAVIFVILLLLVAIIFFCELRKKKLATK